LPTGAGFVDNSDGSGTFNWTPTFLQSGSYDVTFYATDDSSAVDSEVVTITVNEVGNQLPELTAIGAKSTDENINLNLTITATDIESIPVLTTSSLPSGAAFLDNGDGTGTFDWTPTFLQSGSYDVTFYATDDSSAVDSEVVTITVNEAGNQLPVLAAIGVKVTTENENLNFDVSATDIESIPVLTTSSLPSGAAFLENGDGTGTFDWTPTFLQSGSYDITFYATDDSSAVDSEIVTITVNEDELGYLVITPDSAIITADSTLQYTVLGLTVLDAVTDEGELTWSLTNPIGSIDSTGLYLPNKAGTTQVIVESDRGVIDTSAYLEITPGTLTSIEITPDDAHVGVGDTVQFYVTGYDAYLNSTDAGSITWQVPGRLGTIDPTGLFISRNPGNGNVYATNESMSLADTSTVLRIEEVYISAVSTGINSIHPTGWNAALVLHIENYYGIDKEITEITIRDNSRGQGNLVQRLGNTDSLAVYLDSDDDSTLSGGDVLLNKAEYSTGLETININGVILTPGSGATLIIAGLTSLYAHDKDTVDLYLLPQEDLVFADSTIVYGSDSLNSFGYNIIDGFVSAQIALTSTGLLTINPADSIYHVMTIDIPRNGYKQDTLNIFSIINEGTATSNDFESLILFKDNGNGVWDGAELETNLDELVYTGSRWMRSGLEISLFEPENRFFVGVRLSNFPSNGSTLALTIPQNGIEMSSDNDGPLDNALIPIDTIAIITNEEVIVETINVVSKELIPGEITDPLIGISFTNSYNSDISIDSINITLFASDPHGATQTELDSQIDSLLIYLNKDNDHSIISPLDQYLGSAYIINGKSLTEFNNLNIPGSGGIIGLTLVTHLNQNNSRNGNQINLGINENSDIFLNSGIMNGVYPLKNNTSHTINAFPKKNVIINPIDAVTLFGGQSDLPVLDFELPRDGYAGAELQRIRLVNQGTFVNLTAIPNVQLWKDVTGNGFSTNDIAIGKLIRTGEYWELTGLSIPLADNTTRFIITVDVSDEQFEGGTLDLMIPVGGISYVSGTIGPDDTGIKNPDAHLVFSADRVTVISIPLMSTAVKPGSSDNNVLTFALYNGYEDQIQNLQSLTLTNISQSSSDMASADYELGQLSMYLDVDNDRIFSDDSLIAIGYFTDGRMQMSGLDVNLPAESLSYFFVHADLPLDVSDNDSLAICISNPSDLSFSKRVNINGDLPLTSGSFLITDGSIEEQYSIIETPLRSLSPGDTSVTLFSFYPAGNGILTDTITSLVIGNAYDADSSEFTSLELWLDTNDDNLWQSSDSYITTFYYSGDTWQTSPIEIEVNSSPSALFIIGDISATATAFTKFQPQIPINGCNFSSDNDGPNDEVVLSDNIFTISNSALKVQYSSLTSTYTVGQEIIIRADVTNLLTFSVGNVFCEVVDIDDETLVTLDSSNAGPVTLSAGETRDFYFYYHADSVGSVEWSLRAVTPSLPDSSPTITTNQINIVETPSYVNVHLINTIPASVIQGQANVYPMSLSISHTDTSEGIAGLKIDSLMMSVEDGSGTNINADLVFSRMVLTNGYNNLSIIENIPADTQIKFIFDEPIIVPRGENKVFSLLIDIDSSSTVGEFALEFDNASMIPVVDENTNLAVPVDPLVVFPLKTALCRIDLPSDMMVIAYSSIHSGFVNFGQVDAGIIQLNMRHPGPIGSSQIQLTGFAFNILDDAEFIINGSDLVTNIDIKKENVTIAEVNGLDLETGEIDVQLSFPITLNAGETDSLGIYLTIKNTVTTSTFKLQIPDSLKFSVRDLSSGSLLEIATDTVLMAGSSFPLESDPVTLKNQALSPEICVASELSPSIVGGVDSLNLLELSIIYPEGDNNSSISLTDILISILDSNGISLDPNQLFDRIGIRYPDNSIEYQPYILTQSGMMNYIIRDNGLLLNPSDTISLGLIGDIESDVNYDHFIIELQNYNDILAVDINDTTYNPGFTLQSSCITDLPFITDPTEIYLPAGRPGIAFETQSVRIAYPGESNIDVFDGNWTYNDSSAVGDLLLHSINGKIYKRVSGGFESVSGQDVFSYIRLYIDDINISTDSIFNNDNLELSIDDYIITRQSNLNVHIVCDIKEDAVLDNYIIRFEDSTFMEISDKNLATVKYPNVFNQSYPILSAEISLTIENMENSFSNYPNPFNPSIGENTTIAYVLTEDATIDIEIFTITGQMVKEVTMNSYRSAGAHQSDNWTGINDAGHNVAPGTYYCRITAVYTSGKTESFKRKIAIIR